MTKLTDSLLRMTLPIPEVGATTKFTKGPLELQLEHQRGGLCLVLNDLDTPRRHFLGLPRRGVLELHVRAPEHRIRVHLEDRLTLASGGRLRGYVRVPMPHRLVWRRPDGKTESLLDVSPRELRTSWLGEGPDGGYVYDTDSLFHLDRHGIPAHTVALVPIVIANHSEDTITPEDLTISIRDRDIRQLEGQIITSPRRLCFGDRQRVDEKIRALPRKSA